MNRLVILPQALRVVVPSFVSIAVGFFQDTSLVVIIGLFDLLNTARVAAQDPAVAWFPYRGVRVRGADLLCGEYAHVPVRLVAGASLGVRSFGVRVTTLTPLDNAAAHGMTRGTPAWNI